MYDAANLIRRNNPWIPFEAFNRAFAPLFGELATGVTGEEAEPSNSRTWAPRVDVLETDEAYQIAAELPGVRKEDVEITVENNVLSLKGDRKFEKEVNKGSYHRIERLYGSFARSFTLPSRVAQDRVEAKFDNGVLMLTIPKVAEARPKKIEIS
jgi:HSP20 family protein